MNRLSMSAGAAALIVLTAAGCNNDQAAAELAEAKAKLNAASKETHALREQLKMSQAAANDALAKVNDLTKRIDSSCAQVIESRNESERNCREVERLEWESRGLKKRLTAAEQSNKTTESAGPKGRDGDNPATKVTSAPDRQRTTEQVMAARDYQFEKITFKTTLAEFKKLYPKIGDPEKGRTGELTYEFYSEPIGTIKVAFLDNNIQTINLFYGEQQLDELGGPHSIAERLVARFGEPDSNQGQSAKWLIASADRFILATTTESGRAIGITFGKISLVAERNKRMRNLDVGF